MAELFNLSGKTVIITGASGGLGSQFARCLSKAGSRVILTDRSFDKIEALSNELHNARAIQMDVTDKQSVARCFAELEKAGEKVDICVNNAGIGVLTPVFEEDDKNNFESIIQTNLMGVWYVTKLAVNHMKDHGIHGSIINIGSIAGLVSYPYDTAYCTSKAAVNHLTKSLVTELSPHGIRINCINPGPVHTPMIDPLMDSEQKQKSAEAMVPLGFIANPQDLDTLLLLLASNDHSSYMTGSCITIDGGSASGYSAEMLKMMYGGES